MTNKDQLNRLKEPWRSQAFENVKTEFRNDEKDTPKTFLSKKGKSLEKTLLNAFLWHLTSQGQKYWEDICYNPQNYLTDETLTCKECSKCGLIKKIIRSRSDF